jgi:tight adherence protein C
VIAGLVICWVVVAVASRKLLFARPGPVDELVALGGGASSSTTWRRSVHRAGAGVAALRRRAGFVSATHEADLAVLGDTTVTFYGEKALATAVLLAWVPVMSLVGVRIPFPVIWTLLFGVVGWFTPNAVVASKAREARRELRNGVAEFALVLSLAVAGGAGLDAAFRGTIESCSGRFADELGKARNQHPRESVRQVIDRVADRLGLVEASTLSTSLSATDYGGAVGETLSELAWGMVQERRIEAMEAVVRAAIKMVVATSALMVPGYLVLVAFPGLRLALHTLTSR